MLVARGVAAASVRLRTAQHIPVHGYPPFVALHILPRHCVGGISICG